MLRREVLRAGSALGITGVAGCVGWSGGPDFTEGFEDGIGEWEPDATIGPEVDVEDFEWEVDVSGAEAAEGDRSLRVWNEGDYDDGVTWASHPVSVESGREYTFEWTTPELSTGTLHFAVGTAVIWEADATHYVDDLSVTVEPRGDP